MEATVVDSHSAFPQSETPPLLAKRGALSVHLSRRAQDIAAAQRLRYQVFHGHRRQTEGLEIRNIGRDSDRYDEYCDHLMVLDEETTQAEGLHCCGRTIVGTYRLMVQLPASKGVEFYSDGEFDLAPLIDRNPEMKFLELGRSCVLESHRNKPVIELLWQGIWNFARENGIDVMIGCASFPGTNVEAFKTELSFLAQHFTAPPQWHVRAKSERYIEMNCVAPDEYNWREVMRRLPPLIRGYLRLGCYIGSGAVVDSEFSTTDIMIILPVSRIHPRYLAYFSGTNR